MANLLDPDAAVDPQPGPAGERVLDEPNEATDPRLPRLGGGWRLGACAFLAYAAVALVLWGLHVVPHPGTTYLSRTNVNDLRFYEWALAWWPHAVGHGLDPLHPTYLWAPGGVNFAWVTCLAGPSLLLAPVTLLAGPLATENLLFLLAPALAGWAAYLLCGRVTGRFWPAQAGGYLFGFSSYLAGQMQGHLNLVLIFPIPLAAYLLVRRAQGDLRRWTFVALLAGVLLLQFSISTEVFATMALMGACFLLGGLALGSRAARGTLLRLTAETGGAYAIALLAALPYIVTALQAPPPPVAWDPLREYLGRYSTDLAGTVVPRPFTLLGGTLGKGVTSRFTVGAAEDGAYFGIPLLLALIAAVAARWRDRLTWLLFGAFAFALVLSMGPVLHVLGAESVPLPWTLAAHVPGLGIALPSRLIVYAWLAAAVLVARWLAGPVRGRHAGGRPLARAFSSRTLRWALVGLAAISILPALPASLPAKGSPFFVDGTFRRYLHPGETVLTLPFYTPSTALTWQLEAGLEFRLAGGYVGWRGIPLGERPDRAVHGLLHDEPGRTPPWALRAFLIRHHVGAVVMSRGARPEWRWVLKQLGLQPVAVVSGLVVFRVPPSL